jgi:hypothetical protein
MYTGIAIRMSQAIRLGREYHQRHNAREQEVRRRTLWTCFIMDRLVSAVCSRPQTLRTIKLRCFLPCPEPSFLLEKVSSMSSRTLDIGPSPDCLEVLPYFIKTIEHWGTMVDIFASGVKGPPSQAPTHAESEFYKAEQALKAWKSSLQDPMSWSMKNYRAHRMLGQGSLFVSLHFVLNNALCFAHQEYLPEFEGDPAFDEQNSPEPSTSRSVVKTCLYHVEEIIRMASSLSSGDDTDREMLRAPFVGLALESAACCQLWQIHLDSMSPESGNSETPNKASPTQKLAMIMDIFKSWEDTWPIAAAWQETIDLLSRLYEAAHPTGMLDFDVSRLDNREEHQPGEITIGSGYPDPQNLSSHRVFDSIRLILMTVADPSSLRHRQTRLHIQNLWNRMFPISNPALPESATTLALAQYGNFSNFDDMLNYHFMDEFEGFPGDQSDSITVSSLSAINPQHSSPFP